MNMVSFPFRNKAFTFNNHLMLSYSNTEGFNNGQRNSSGTFSVGESFGIAWRPENVELELRPNYRMSTVHNSFARQSDRTTHTYGGTFYGSYTTPFGVTIGSDVNYSATSGYSQDSTPRPGCGTRTCRTSSSRPRRHSDRTSIRHTWPAQQHTPKCNSQLHRRQPLQLAHTLCDGFTVVPLQYIRQG